MNRRRDTRLLSSSITHFVSPPVFFGFNPHSEDKKYRFADTNGQQHVIETFEDAVDLLINIYSKILVNCDDLARFIKRSPSGNWAYLSYKRVWFFPRSISPGVLLFIPLHDIFLLICLFVYLYFCIFESHSNIK